MRGIHGESNRRTAPADEISAYSALAVYSVDVQKKAYVGLHGLHHAVTPIDSTAWNANEQ